MKSDDRVQFVCFETALDKEQFLKRWEQYTHSLNSNVDVTLQQSERNGIFRYIAQHRFASHELQFNFSNEPRSRIVHVPIKTSQAGGYSILQSERLDDSVHNESKIFVFLTDSIVDLDIYKQLLPPGNLNIYEAYYENCRYSYILEYFVETKNTANIQEALEQFSISDVGIYKECLHVKNRDRARDKGLLCGQHIRRRAFNKGYGKYSFVIYSVKPNGFCQHNKQRDNEVLPNTLLAGPERY